MFRPDPLVFVVVVEGQLLAGGVGQLEHGIQRRVEPAGIDLGDDLVAGTALEAEHVPVAGLSMRPLTMIGKRDLLGGLLRIVRLLFQAFRQRVHRKGHAVGDLSLLAARRADRRPVLVRVVLRQAWPRAGSSP